MILSSVLKLIASANDAIRQAILKTCANLESVSKVWSNSNPGLQRRHQWVMIGFCIPNRLLSLTMIEWWIRTWTSSLLYSRDRLGFFRNRDHLSSSSSQRLWSTKISSLDKLKRARSLRLIWTFLLSRVTTQLENYTVQSVPESICLKTAANHLPAEVIAGLCMETGTLIFTGALKVVQEQPIWKERPNECTGSSKLNKVTRFRPRLIWDRSQWWTSPQTVVLTTSLQPYWLVRKGTW